MANFMGISGVTEDGRYLGEGTENEQGEQETERVVKIANK